MWKKLRRPTTSGTTTPRETFETYIEDRGEPTGVDSTIRRAGRSSRDSRSDSKWIIARKRDREAFEESTS